VISQFFVWLVLVMTRPARGLLLPEFFLLLGPRTLRGVNFFSCRAPLPRVVPSFALESLQA